MVGKNEQKRVFNGFSTKKIIFSFFVRFSRIFVRFSPYLE
jgi:hypothetical protein